MSNEISETPRRRGPGKEGKAHLQPTTMALAQKILIEVSTDLTPELQKEALKRIVDYLRLNEAKSITTTQMSVTAYIRGSSFARSARQQVTSKCYDIGTSLGRTKGQKPYLHVRVAKR